MKKLFVSVLILLLFCGCTKGVESCPAAEEPEMAEAGAPLAPSEMMEEPETKPVVEEVDIILKEPCTLTISNGSAHVRTMGGTYSWWYDNGDGTQSGIEACGMHPLDLEDDMPLLMMDGTEAQLLFGSVEPDRVTIRGWSVRQWGNTEAEAEEIPVDGLCFPLKNEGFIYEVTATWDRFDRWGGTAYYTFCAAPLGVELHVEAATDKWVMLSCTQSGGNPSGELQTGQPFWLEQQDEDGNWIPIYEPQAWEDLADLIPRENTVQWKLSWEKSIGSLPSGAYRVGKEITDYRGPADYDTYKIWSDNFFLAWAEETEN